MGELRADFFVAVTDALRQPADRSGAPVQERPPCVRFPHARHQRVRLVRLRAGDLRDLVRVDAHRDDAVVPRKGESLYLRHRGGEAPERQRAEHRAGVVVEGEEDRAVAEIAVSYTHLTLPTIYS